jgi:two-component system, OmpR family, response regulator ResD
VVTGAATGRILVVDDDETVAEVVSRYLEREGYEVRSVGEGPAALESAARWAPDLVVLDLMLPGLDGLEVCRRLRLMGPVPVIMLTARGEESDRVVGFEVGADDYVAKPFSPRELTLRVNSVLRRARAAPGEPAGAAAQLSAGALELDPAARQARRGGALLQLTTLEFDLLRFLVSHPRRVFTREELLEQVWGYSFGDTSTVTVHVRRLREKIEEDPSAPRHIQTVWGSGYRFDP